MISCAESETVVLKEPHCVRPLHEERCLEFRSLYQAHFDGVMRLVLRFGVERHDAEDLTQRVFMVAFRQCSEAQPI